MTKNGLVSIVLPTFNGSKFIKESIDSCLNQSYKEIELIIVDDCSTDSTIKIIKKFNDKRIRYLRHVQNRGLPEALNTGFKASLGYYLTWTSDDNYYAADAIDQMVKRLEKEKSNFVYADYYQFSDDENREQKIINLIAPPNFYSRNPIGACFLYNRQVFEEVGLYDPEVFLVEDIDYWIRVSKKYKMIHLPKPLYYYRIHAGTLTANKYSRIRVSVALTRLKYGIWSLNKTCFYLCLFGVGLYFKRLKRFLLYFFKIRSLLNEFNFGKQGFAKTRDDILLIIAN